MIFPRIAALSEVLWSPKEVRTWDDFSRRIQMFMKRYDLMGINYAKSAFCVTAKTEIDTAKNQFAVNLSGEFPNLEIRYTTDNNEPNNLSALYSSPVVIDKTTTLKAITFVNNTPVNKSISKTFNINKATFKPVNYLIPYSNEYMGSGKLTLVNGISGSTNYSDGEWQAWAGDNMNVVIDLQDTTEIHHISVGTIQNTGAWIFFPKKIDFYVSMDGLYYRKIAESLNIVDPLSDGIQLQKYSASFTAVNARYVKVYAHSIGKCPKGHVGAGQAAWLFADEISVE
jgi:hexosaminidase